MSYRQPMPPTPPDPGELDAVVAFVADEARKYLDAVEDRPVRDPHAEDAAASFGGALPEDGVGAVAALQELIEGGGGLVHSAGPRFFHFVNGGATPAALGADWLTSTWDQNPGAWVATPLGGHLESVALGWLKELFGLPRSWGGILTTGATMANFTALACARRWWGLRQGVDVDVEGLGGLPRMSVLGSGYVHPSDTKALAMLGLGRDAVRKLAADGTGRLDLAALERELKALGDAPAVVIASAGEVNAGDFDPLAAMADLAERYGAWLHVDGAFGLFAALSDRSRHLIEGVERADSVIADGHKWLNVPYDCGFAFVKDAELQAPVFTSGAAYLPDPLGPKPTWGFLGPEMSRRARAFTVWATLRAYGRSGYQAIVEKHLDLAEHLARRVDEEPDLERLADVRLNIVCFRYHPRGYAEDRLDELNRKIGEEAILDGRVFFGMTEYDGKVAFRPAAVNWRNRPEDVDLIVDVVLELGARFR
jgi:glutamate/tyrosine decarboxylase-like PLP-dependent enzyme